MSPTLVFPPPFRRRDLTPYGPSDWKRVQPVLLRRSLALSSAASLAVALLLSFLLHQAAVLMPDQTHYIIPPPPAPPPIPGWEQPPAIPPANVRKEGGVIPIPHDIPALQDSMVAPPNPGPFDPNATVPIGTPAIPGSVTGEKSDYPDRPDPNVFVAYDEAPKDLYTPKPEYPELARQANIEGTVVLKVLVNREGNVQEILMQKSNPVFDDAAEQAVRTWRFRPAIMGHEPVAAWVSVPIHFILREE